MENTGTSIYMNERAVHHGACMSGRLKVVREGHPVEEWCNASTVLFQGQLFGLYDTDEQNPNTETACEIT